MDYILNSFSLNMVQPPCTISVREMAPEKVPVDAVSAVGHESTAKMLTSLLRREVSFNRATVTLKKGDRAYITALFEGGKPWRAPEGKVLGVVELGLLTIKIVEVWVGGAVTPHPHD